MFTRYLNKHFYKKSTPHSVYISTIVPTCYAAFHNNVKSRSSRDLNVNLPAHLTLGQMKKPS